MSQEKHELKGSIGVLLLFVQDFPKILAIYRDKLGLPVSNIHPGKGYEPLVDWARFELEGPEGAALELFDGRPELHYSTQKRRARIGAHADRIDVRDFTCFIDGLSRCTVDVILEAKAKDRELLRLRRDLQGCYHLW